MDDRTRFAVLVIVLLIVIYYLASNCAAKQRFTPYAGILKNDIYRSDPAFDNRQLNDAVPGNIYRVDPYLDADVSN